MSSQAATQAATSVATATKRRSQLLALYRSLLKNCRVFPSIKRDVLYEDIRIEFRENRSLTDPDKIDLEIERAIRGYQTMRKYTSLDPNANSWSIDLEKNPMPAPEGHYKTRALSGGEQAT